MLALFSFGGNKASKRGFGQLQTLAFYISSLSLSFIRLISQRSTQTRANQVLVLPHRVHAVPQEFYQPFHR